MPKITPTFEVIKTPFKSNFHNYLAFNVETSCKRILQR